MTDERWSEIKKLADEALDYPSDKRRAFILHACGGDLALHAEVDSLLEQADRTGGLIDQPLFNLRGAIAQLPDPSSWNETPGHQMSVEGPPRPITEQTGRIRSTLLPEYSHLTVSRSRTLPADLKRRENEPLFGERRTALQRMLLAPPRRPPTDAPLLTTVWTRDSRLVTMSLPGGGYGLPVFSTRMRAADYVDVQLNHDPSLVFRTASPTELVSLLRTIDHNSITHVACDPCPRCPVLICLFDIHSIKTVDDVVTVWAITKSGQVARHQLYLHYAIESARLGQLERARDVSLEIVGHITADDPRAHILLGQLAIGLGDRQLLGEAHTFLRLLKCEWGARDLDGMGHSGPPGYGTFSNVDAGCPSGSGQAGWPEATVLDEREKGEDLGERRQEDRTTDPMLRRPDVSIGVVSHVPNWPDAFAFSVGDLIEHAFRVKDMRRGGMGIVYLVEREESDSGDDARRQDYVDTLPGDVAGDTAARLLHRPWFAIKMPHRAALTSVENTLRFERECLVWSTLLPHPNIVHALTTDRIADLLPFVLLEYVNGGNLRDRLRDGLELTTALHIALHVCRGMQFLAESGGLVHRDIKPENILLTKDGLAKVTDFGLVQVRPPPSPTLTASDADLREPALASDGVVAGSIPYMAPEQFLGLSADTRSDIYSFGVVLYEMFAGRRPFGVADFNTSRHWHLFEGPVAPLEVADVPPEISEIILKCLAKQPDDRFQSFAELGTRLAAFCGAHDLVGIVPAYLSADSLHTSMDAEDWSGRARALFTLGSALFGRDQKEQARPYLERAHAYFQRAADVEPTRAASHSEMGQILALLDRHDEALGHFQEHALRNGSQVLPFIRLAQCRERLGRIKGALNTLRKAARRFPTDVSLQTEIVLFCARHGITSGVKEHARKAIRGIPRSMTRPQWTTVWWWLQLLNHWQDPSSSIGLRAVRLTLPGWSEQAAEAGLRGWRNHHGDALVLAIGGLPEFSDDIALQGWARRFAERRNAGLIEARVVAGTEGPGVALVYKQLKQRARVFTGMLTLPHQHGYTWAVMAEEHDVRIGAREAIVAAELMNSGKLTVQDYERFWSRDPYDACYRGVDRPALRCMADHECYDERFPEHPLSRIRHILAALEQGE